MHSKVIEVNTAALAQTVDKIYSTVEQLPSLHMVLGMLTIFARMLVGNFFQKTLNTRTNFVYSAFAGKAFGYR